MSDTDTEQRELPHGDHERIVVTARGLVTNDLMIADLERREWVIALTMMVDKLAEYSNLGLILVPFAPHASMPWINGIAPGMVMQCQCVASEDIDALRIECERMYQALHPLSPPEEGTTMTREQEEYEDIPGIDPRPSSIPTRKVSPMTTTNDRHSKGPGPWCGTAGGYSNHDCRCDECTDAWRVACRAYMARNPEQRERHRARVAVWKAQQQEATA